MNKARVVKALRAVVALCLLSVCSACLGPNHATARLARFNNDIDNRWAKQGTFMVLLPGYLVFSLGDNLVFNSIYWWTGNNPVDPPKDDSAPKDFGW